MVDHRIRTIPIVTEGTAGAVVVGVVTRRDLAPALKACRRVPMAEYDFECRLCKKVFTLFMRTSERLKATIRCPGCGSDDVEALMQSFVARTAKKS